MLLRHLAALLALPFVVTVIVPSLLLASAPFQPGWGLPAPFDLLPSVAGIAALVGGVLLVASTVWLFVRDGGGTLAPWDPTRRLVVAGVYRYVRNPMITGVFLVLLGDSLLFGSLALLIWTAAFAAVNIIYIPLSEEPGLRQRFGADYDEYARAVPRWLPRRTPWRPPADAP